MPTNLEDYEDVKSGGEWLPEGTYRLRVTACSGERVAGQKGNRVVEYELCAEDGRKTKASYWLTKEAGGLLKKLAKDCGLDEAARRRFDYPDLIGKEIMGRVIPDNNDSRYHKLNIFNTWAIDAPEPPSHTPNRTLHNRVENPPMGKAQPSYEGAYNEDDIPF